MNIRIAAIYIYKYIFSHIHKQRPINHLPEALEGKESWKQG